MLETLKSIEGSSYYKTVIVAQLYIPSPSLLYYSQNVSLFHPDILFAIDIHEFKRNSHVNQMQFVNRK